jgi:hypothetical protein
VLSIFFGVCTQVHGVLRLTANTLSMTSSQINIVANSGEVMVATSIVEASNMAYIQVGGYKPLLMLLLLSGFSCNLW